MKNIGPILSRKNFTGTIKESPDEIIKALEEHQKRLNSFDDDKMMNALRDDPIWTEWNQLSKEILIDLIKD